MWIECWLAALVAAGGCAPAGPAMRAGADAFGPLVVGPYLLAPDATSMTVCWETARPAAGRVEFGPTQRYGQTVRADDPAVRHKVTLTGLTPGATYHYRVVTPAGASGDFAFRALPGPGQPLTFIVDGDQCGSPTAAALQAAYAKIRPHLVISSGDIAGDREDDYAALLTMDRRLWASTPWFPVFGNHDLIGDRGGRGAFRDAFAIPDPRLPGRDQPIMIFYSFDAGGCHFAVADTIDYYVGVDPAAPGAAGRERLSRAEIDRQRAWLADDLEAAGASRAAGRSDFIFTFCHDSGEDFHEYRNARRPPMDIYFYGGYHNYFRGRFDNALTVVQASGGGTWRLRPPPESDWVKASRMCFNYVRVDVAGGKLTLRAYDLGEAERAVADPDGELMDTFEMAARTEAVEMQNAK